MLGWQQDGFESHAADEDNAQGTQNHQRLVACSSDTAVIDDALPESPAWKAKKSNSACSRGRG